MVYKGLKRGRVFKELRAICFSPKLQIDLQTLGKASSPVKLLSNFRTQDDGSLNTILMDNRLQIAETKVSFPPKPKPQTNNIASLSGVNLQQLITIKAKVLRLGATNMVTTSNSVKRKAECYLTDPSGTIKLKLWENFIN